MVICFYMLNIKSIHFNNDVFEKSINYILGNKIPVNYLRIHKTPSLTKFNLIKTSKNSKSYDAKKKINHGIYNVGSGQKMQVSKILKITKSLIRNGELELGRLRMRKDEMIYNYPKITKVEKEFKWKSKISIKNGLIKTIKYYESI